MRTLIVLAIAAFVGLIVVIVFANAGLYDVRASSPHGSMMDWMMSTTSRASIERGARDVDVPDLDDNAIALAGINDFNAMCVGCHGAPGRKREAVGLGLNPRAPDLAESAERLSPAELFWVTKHGIRMTGMPAWGATHDDDELWPVVAFLTKLPGLDVAGYEAMLTSAEGAGHHAAGAAHSHEHGMPGDDHGEADAAATPDAAPHADSAEHDHSAHSHDQTATESTTKPQGDELGHNH